MTYKVIISNSKHTFPLKGLNELLAGRLYNYRTKTYHNPVKASNDLICLKSIRKCLKNVKIENPIVCHFYIYAADKRHDRGNLYTATEKSFLDALQKAKVIKNDGWDDVGDSVFHTYVDRKNPRVVVEIIEIEKGKE